jgi:hypothetical protein
MTPEETFLTILRASKLRDVLHLWFLLKMDALAAKVERWAVAMQKWGASR